jgi:DeoR/GlpR family transcriptional regulator of sugar metabolism
VRIFMSHHSSTKPLVREVRDSLPEHVNSWVDEYEILVGESIGDRLHGAIDTGTDFLIVFFDSRAAESDWVRTELNWAMEEEEKLKRPFVLPVVLEDGLDEHFPWSGDRLYLRCSGFSESQVRYLAQEISSSLFAWLSRDLELLRARPSDSTSRLLFADRADALLEEAAHHVRSIVFPYRRDRPLPLTDLLARLAEETDLRLESLDDLHSLLYRLRDRKMISGIAMTGRAIFVGEEHLNWRSQEAVEEKRQVAEYVVDSIEDGWRIYLDGGSSTLAVCRALCRGVRYQQWSRLTVVTNAVPIAAELSDLANDLGLEDEDPRLRVLVRGGEMRLNTSVMINPDGHQARVDTLGRYDLAVLGTNGVSIEFGCTTTAPSEAIGKRMAIKHSERRFVLAEPSKYGVWQTEQFATFDEGLSILTACSAPDEKVDQLRQELTRTSSEIVLISI